MAKRYAFPRSALIWLLSIALVMAIPFVYLAWMVGTFKGTNVSFQSSDGEWADSEVLFKGREFQGIREGFETYRANCARDARLQRTTPKPKWNAFDHWFNDYSAPKWQVPYAPALPNAVRGYYPPVDIKHCANRS